MLADGTAIMQRYLAGTVTLSAELGATQVVELAPGESLDVTLTRKRPPIVRGRVLCEGRGVPGVTVSAYRPRVESTEHDDFGDDSVQLSPGIVLGAHPGQQATSDGAIELSLEWEGEARLRASTDEGISCDSEPFLATWGGTSVIDLQFTDSNRITGRVVDAASEDGLGGAYLVLWGGSAGACRTPDRRRRRSLRHRHAARRALPAGGRR
jgi:hypothetical protein